MNILGTTSILCAALLTTGACTMDQADENTSETEQHTAGSGTVSISVARANLGAAKVDIKWQPPVGKRVHSKIAGDLDLQLQQVTFAPGGHTGWHTHPGPAFVSILEGTGTLYSGEDPCSGVEYSAGTGFIDQADGNVHRLVNEGTTPLRIYVQLVVPKGVFARIDAPAPPGASACP